MQITRLHNPGSRGAGSRDIIIKALGNIDDDICEASESTVQQGYSSGCRYESFRRYNSALHCLLCQPIKYLCSILPILSSQSNSFVETTQQNSLTRPAGYPADMVPGDMFYLTSQSIALSVPSSIFYYYMLFQFSSKRGYTI